MDRATRIAMLRRAAERARTRASYVASVCGGIDEVSADLGLTERQTCLLFLCALPHSLADCEIIAGYLHAGDKARVLYQALVAGERRP